MDPEARHARKSRSQRRDGYKAHICAEPPDTGLITAVEFTTADPIRAPTPPTDPADPTRHRLPRQLLSTLLASSGGGFVSPHPTNSS